MPAPEHLHGWRVVARPEALDAVEVAVPTALRIAPDDLLVLGEAAQPAVDDPDAIAAPEDGFVGWHVGAPECAALLHRHVEWELPTARPALAQGLVAGVPAKLWLREDGSALLLCSAAYAAELEGRIA